MTTSGDESPDVDMALMLRDRKTLYLVRFTTIVPVLAEGHDDAKFIALDYLDGQMDHTDRWNIQSAEVRKAASLPKGIGHLKPFNAALGSETCKRLAEEIERRREADEKYQLKLFEA